MYYMLESADALFLHTPNYRDNLVLCTSRCNDTLFALVRPAK